jgi:glucuronate isomerase
MVKQFIHKDFLLENAYAKTLYHTYAEPLPIIDFHCHLPAKEIADNKRFENMTEIWLYGDHYKWRAMRSAGVNEYYITGAASDWEKFEMWASTVPKTVRNPLYHWTHLELRRPFGIAAQLLNEKTARDIWNRCNAKLARKEFSTQGILKQMNVEIVCTTDDPVDALSDHERFASQSKNSTKMVPAFRPDKAMAVDNPKAFNAYVRALETAAQVEIKDFETLVEAVRKRHDYFHAHGCRLSDHGLEEPYADDYVVAEVNAVVKKLRSEEAISREEAGKFKSAMMYEFGIMDHEKGWVLQLHMGALRNNNTRMLQKLGPDTGFDSIGDFEIARPLAKFLNRLDAIDKLPKTILFNLNPRDNELLAAMIGNFQDGSIAGKIQYGPAWWFLDQKDGMTKQLEALSNMGLLSQFVGMVTDSRSFLSYPRHEYFRRVLCNILGTEMSKGLIPADMKLIGSMVQNICYYNAKRYFQFAA